MQIDTTVISVRLMYTYMKSCASVERSSSLICEIMPGLNITYYIIFGNEDTYEGKKKKMSLHIFDLFFRIDFTPTLSGCISRSKIHCVYFVCIVTYVTRYISVL